MEETVTTAQMRAIEAAAIAAGAVTGRALMERAGAGVVAAILAEWPDLAGRAGRAVVLCGPGNNGGDGFVVARLLHGRGWEVTAWLYGDPDRLPPDARANSDRWRQLGRLGLLPRPVVARWFFDYLPAADGLGPGDLAVDALFGLGLARPATDVARLFQRYSPPGRSWRTVAVDVPSGIDADTGLPPPDGPACGAAGPVPAAFDADLTVTFHAAKPGHRAGAGRPPFGRVVVVDIGLPRGT